MNEAHPREATPASEGAPRTPSSGEALMPGPIRSHATLFATIGLAIALVGYLRGIREVPLANPRPNPAAQEETSAKPAVSYAELPGAKLKPNAGWKSDLSSLKFDCPGVFDKVERTEEKKLSALLDRASNRAFDGAPPTIPHPVTPGSESSCLACHGSGLKVGDRVATKMSHPFYSNCTQCHVEGTTSAPTPPGPGIENSFTGVGRAGPGERFGPGSPPTIPHSTWMRQDCVSCHGLIARPGLRTTHPWLSNCTQCHAPSAALDQAAFPLGSGK